MAIGNKVNAGGITKTVMATFTRPNDTTTYAAGDVMADSTSAATIMTFPACAIEDGGSGLVQSVGLLDGANQALKLDADLFLFTVAPASYGNDNDPFTPTDAELLNRVACIQLPSSNMRNGDATSGAGGNAVCDVGNLAYPFKCPAGDNSLYWVLVARNAYIPIANSPFYITLGILQD